jgi:DNA-binding transcriptional MerR regulator
MTRVAYESSQAYDLIERIETLERVAETLPEEDDRRLALLGLVEQDLASAHPFRPRVAAEVLDISEKTVRAWTREGVLKRAAGPSSRVLLDVQRVHQVLLMVKDLRAAGKTVGLLDEVHRRLVDASSLQRDDVTESLEQMRRGEGTTPVAKPSA